MYGYVSSLEGITYITPVTSFILTAIYYSARSAAPPKRGGHHFGRSFLNGAAELAGRKSCSKAQAIYGAAEG